MKKLTIAAASAATMIALSASPAMAQSFSTTDNSVNNSFNDNSTNTQVVTQSITQTNTVTSGNATASGDGSFAFSGASNFAQVQAFQTAVQSGNGFWFYF